jgi:hypothetical protein
MTCVKTGFIGKEPGGMVFVGADGSLIVKILKRQAELDFKEVSSGPQPEQTIPLSIGKKTKVYLEKALFERENANGMDKKL